MVIENLTQRAGEFREEAENLKAIRNYLKKSVAVQTLNTKRSDGQDLRPQNIQETGSVRHIVSWLNKNGEVMAMGKISQTIKNINFF